MHHTGHHAGHTHQREILDRKIKPENMIQRIGEQEPGHTSHEQRRGERSAHSACSVGGRCGKRFCHGQRRHECYYEQHGVSVGIENGAVHYRRRVSLKQGDYGAVAFAIQRWEQEDQT